MLPFWIDVFFAPVRDNMIEQVALTGALLLMLFDMVFGVINALLKKEFSSTKMREGIGHKCGEIGFILVGIIIDGMIVGGFDIGVGPVLLVICTALVVAEIGSLMEILVKLWPDIAKCKPFKLLESVKEENNDKGDS